MFTKYDVDVVVNNSVDVSVDKLGISNIFNLLHLVVTFDGVRCVQDTFLFSETFNTSSVHYFLSHKNAFSMTKKTSFKFHLNLLFKKRA